MPRTCVIGAGGSGLVAAKTLLADGHDVVVLERAEQLGGVWAPWRAFPGLHTQTPVAQFEFSDFAFPEGTAGWPPAAAVHAYLCAYAERFGVRERIRFRSEVVGVAPAAGGGWLVHARRDGETVAERFDRVVLSTGIFDSPVLPDVPGREAFEAAGGTVVHSARCTDPRLLEGRRVVVVGIQKTATDLAVYAAEHGCSVDIVYRRARWKLARRFLGVVSIADTLYTRSFDALSRLGTSVPSPSRRQRIVHPLTRRPVGLYFRALELVLRAQFRLDRREMLPDNHIEDEAHCGVTIETPGFYAALGTGAIRAHRTVVAALEPGVAVLGSGERVAADIVVYATGYEVELPYLPAEVRAELFDADGCLRLYRNVLAPALPTLGFVGFNSAIASPIAAELAAHWLAAHWGGRMTLPAPAAMHEHIAAELRWRMERWPETTRALRNACVGLQHHYMDGLMHEMGLRPKVPGIRAATRALRPADYAALLAAGPSRNPVRPLVALRAGLVIFSGPLALIGATVAATVDVVRSLRARRLPRPRSAAMLAAAAAYGAELPRLRGWGATAHERCRRLAGDELAPDAGVQHTRAVTIDAPPERVWPWLAQIGQDRAGFYSYTWLENLAGCRMKNADRVHPEWQQRAVGDSLLLHHAAGLEVLAIDPGRSLAFEGGWSFVLESDGPGRSRLLARWRFARGPLGTAFALLFELPHHLMERRMLLGIKRRAERDQPRTRQTNASCWAGVRYWRRM